MGNVALAHSSPVIAARRPRRYVPWIVAGTSIGCLAMSVLAARAGFSRSASDGPLTGVARVIGYSGVILFVGTLAFWLLIWPSGSRDPRLIGIARLGLLLTAVSAPAGLMATLAEAGATTSIPAGFGVLLERPAAPLLARIAICAVAMAWLTCHRRRMRASRTLGAVLVFSLVLTVVTARPGPLTVTAMALTEVHVLAAAGWVGGLAALAVAVVPRRNSTVLHATLGSFSWLSMACVCTLAVTGTAHALLGAGGLRPLLDSEYGVALLAKLGAVAGMLCAATGSHSYVTRLRSRPAPVQVIALFVGAELAFGAAAVVLTSALATAAT